MKFLGFCILLSLLNQGALEAQPGVHWTSDSISMSARLQDNDTVSVVLYNSNGRSVLIDSLVIIEDVSSVFSIVPVSPPYGERFFALGPNQDPKTGEGVICLITFQPRSEQPQPYRALAVVYVDSDPIAEDTVVLEGVVATMSATSSSGPLPEILQTPTGIRILNVPSSELKYSIVDVHGRVVRPSASHSSQWIDITKLPIGVYYLQVAIDSRTLQYKFSNVR